MSVLDRSALEASPLADLHAIASELGLDGFRRLRKAELIDAILARQSGAEEDTETPDEADVAPAEADVAPAEEKEDEREAAPAARPRRSERYPSLIRVDTINGRPADEVAEGTRYDDLPAAFPTERIELGGDDPTLKAIEWLTPFGKGSRVTIAGPARAGKTEALRRLAEALAGQEDVQLLAVLAGVRPEEIAEWENGPVQPAAAANFAASADIQDQTV